MRLAADAGAVAASGGIRCGARTSGWWPHPGPMPVPELDKPYPVRRQLRRSNNRIVAGVCGGFAEWLVWDPLVARLFFLGFSLVSWFVPGILVYIFCWTMMPKAVPADSPQPAAGDTRHPQD